MLLIKRLPVRLGQRLGVLGPWLVAQDPQLLCKRLRIDGFEHLVTADEGPDPVVLRVETEGPWQAALWVVAYYRGPLAVRLGSGLDAKSLAGLETVGVTLATLESYPRLAVLGASEGATLRARASFDGKAIRVSFLTEA